MKRLRGVVVEDEAGQPRLPEPLPEEVIEQAIARAAPEDGVKVAVPVLTLRKLVGHVDEAEVFFGPDPPNVAVVAATVAL